MAVSVHFTASASAKGTNLCPQWLLTCSLTSHRSLKPPASPSHADPLMLPQAADSQPSTHLHSSSTKPLLPHRGQRHGSRPTFYLTGAPLGGRLQLTKPRAGITRSSQHGASHPGHFQEGRGIAKTSLQTPLQSTRDANGF